ncbi:hypothetical protein GY45DRAFT_500437 [Cubamyces sp. BRFM 1775]|nr:hypothetical protein GY45DRAFT_500437 [Cubamyces sp. BRFM 1775]
MRDVRWQEREGGSQTSTLAERCAKPRPPCVTAICRGTEGSLPVSSCPCHGSWAARIQALQQLRSAPARLQVRVLTQETYISQVAQLDATPT